jgi:hypothetical protein
MPSAPIWRTASNSAARCRCVVDHDDPLAAGCADDVAPRALTVLDGAGAQIVAVEVEQIEGEIREPLGAALAQRLGQPVDMGDAALIGHRDLAVDHQGWPAKPLERCAKQRGAVVAIAAQQLDVVAVDDRQQPMPVMLDLVQLALALRRRGAGRNDLRGDALKQISRNRAGGKRECRHGISGGNISAGRCSSGTVISTGRTG